MKVIGIVCSPRKGGNTETLVKEALYGAKEIGAETDLLRISEMRIAPCDGCMACHTSGECKIMDDMQEIYQKIVGADGIIIGSPVYFWCVSSQAKTLMDRTYALRYPYRKLKNKVGGGMVATGRRGSASALSTINNFFLAHEMLVTGIGISGHGTEIGEVQHDEHIMRGARSFGKQMVQLIEIIKLAQKTELGRN